MDRGKNAIRNIGFGIINKIVCLILPFAVRTVFIYTLGNEYLGLNSLFTSILQILNLSELGLNSAIVFCMYRPVANNNVDEINALLAFYKKIYRVIGSAILLIGVSLIPFLEILIKEDYPNSINIVLVYLVYLLDTVLGYGLFSYLESIIFVMQRDDINSKISALIRISSDIIRIMVLLIYSDYLLYALIMPIATITHNIMVKRVIEKNFPQYYPKGELEKSTLQVIKQKVKGLVLNKLCSVSRNSFDSVFLSVFLGLSITAVYSNYLYIMSTVLGLLQIIVVSIISGVGNSVAVESIEKNYEDLTKINFIYMWIAGWFAICMLCLCQPFIVLWIGEDALLSWPCVILLFLYFIVVVSGDILSAYVQATGIWWEMRYRILLETVCNIIFNYFGVMFFGIEGVIASTLVSVTVFGTYLSARIVFENYFGLERLKQYMIRYCFYFLAIVLTGASTWRVTSFFDMTIKGFCVKIVICIIMPNIVFFVLYRRMNVYKESVKWLKIKIKKIVAKRTKK